MAPIAPVKIRFVGFALLVAGLIILLIISQRQQANNYQYLIGHNGSPLLSFLYAAPGQANWNQNLSLVRLNSTSSVGYALLSGDIAAGFIEPERVLELKKLEGAEKLVVAGKVTFPYGASIVVAGGSNLRLGDLNGKRVAVEPNNRKLIAPFLADATRFGVTLNRDDFQVMSADAIIPALEAGKIDAALTKGSQAVLAKHAGHLILYQRWDLVPGDECCPAIIDQLEYVLLVREDLTNLNGLLSHLEKSSALNPDSLRSATAKAIRVPPGTLNDLPLATFEIADRELLSLFGLHSKHNHEHQKVAIKNIDTPQNSTQIEPCQLQNHDNCSH